MGKQKGPLWFTKKSMACKHLIQSSIYIPNMHGNSLTMLPHSIHSLCHCLNSAFIPLLSLSFALTRKLPLSLSIPLSFPPSPPPSTLTLALCISLLHARQFEPVSWTNWQIACLSGKYWTKSFWLYRCFTTCIHANKCTCIRCDCRWLSASSNVIAIATFYSPFSLPSFIHQQASIYTCNAIEG